jgi:thiamine pyrophosphokinase
MSSHHFVREDQEPALIIANANAASYEIIQQLLEWSPTVIVLESALQEALTWGIKLDVVVAVEENVKALALELQQQAPLKFVSCCNHSEALATAIYFLVAAKQKAVNILSDEVLDFFDSFSTIDITVFQHAKRWSLVRHKHYEKWLTAGSVFEVYHQRNTSKYEVKEDGVVEIKRKGNFWVGEV